MIAIRPPAAAAVAIALGGAALASTAGGQSGSDLPPCDPNRQPTLRLVAPKSLPTGYRGGVHLDRVRGGTRYAGFEGMTVAPAEGGQFRNSYAGASLKKRDVFLRWRLQFEKGDGPARVTAAYMEGQQSDGHSTCRRELSAVVQHEAMPDPRLKVRKRVGGRWARRHGSFGVLWSVRVRGTLRKGAKRPVLLELYPGFRVHRYELEVRRRVKPRRGRFAAVLKVFTSGATGPGGMHLRARYPGDLPELFPCADFNFHDEYCGSVSDPRKTL